MALNQYLFILSEDDGFRKKFQGVVSINTARTSLNYHDQQECTENSSHNNYIMLYQQFIVAGHSMSGVHGLSIDVYIYIPSVHTIFNNLQIYAQN